MSRINLKSDLGTIVTNIPAIQTPTASNTLTPIVIGAIPTGARYIDIQFRNYWYAWETVIKTVSYHHIDIINIKYQKNNVFSTDRCNNGIYFWNADGAAHTCNYMMLTINNSILYIAAGDARNHNTSRWEKESIFTDNTCYSADVSVTFYDK